MLAERSRPILTAVALILAPLAEAAGEEPSALAGDSFDAMPGVARVGVAGPLSAGTAVAAFAGYGFTHDVLPGFADDSHHRALGQLAVSHRIAQRLGLGIRLDGRYDKHLNVEGGEDDGWVGDPRVLARATAGAGAISYGGQLTLWFPGGDAPSLIPGATSVDALLLGSFAPPASPFTVSGNLGYRLDRSAESVSSPMSLSLADRMALGASDADAILAGVGATYRARGVELLGEWSWDLLVGADAPPALESPMRLTCGARIALGETVSAQAIFDLNVARTPSLDRASALVPVEPRIRVVAGLHYRFARGERRRGKGTLLGGEDTPPAEIAPSPPPAILEGRVVSGERGVSGARVAVTTARRSEPIEVTAGDEGAFRIDDLPAGAARVSAVADGYEASVRELRLVAGSTRRVELLLEPQVPPGQLRGVVRSIRGEILAAKLTIEPIGLEATTDDDGAFEIDLPPGDYDLVVEARGHSTQRQRVRIEQDGVTIINADMKPRR